MGARALIGSAGKQTRPPRWSLIAAATLTISAMVAPSGAHAAMTPDGVTANSNPPDVPINLQVDSCYLACASPAVVRSGTPQLRATVSDPDGGVLRAEYEVLDAAQTTLVATSGTALTGVTSGSARLWQLVPLSGSTLPDGSYSWRARGCDSQSCGEYSEWFTFTVDTRSMPVPSVSGTPYAEKSTGTWNGGPGQPGTFTFTPGLASPEVAGYVYSLNSGSHGTVAGPTAVVSIMVVQGGVNRLEVWARNSAGTTSDPRVYDFLVSPSSGTWRWELDEPAGSVVAQSSPADFPASLSQAGVTWQPNAKTGSGAVALDGSGQLATSTPVLDTTAPAGFTVAAWVRLTDAIATRTVVSQDGAHTSMFRLGLRKDRDLDGDAVVDAEWCFTLTSSDAVGAPETRACTAEYLLVGEWVSLVGVYDRPTNQIRLYVNGTENLGGAVATAAYYGGWSATGAFVMGRAWAGAATEGWVGDIDYVHAAQRAWSSSDIDRFTDR